MIPVCHPSIPKLGASSFEEHLCNFQYSFDGQQNKSKFYRMKRKQLISLSFLHYSLLYKWCFSFANRANSLLRNRVHLN